jgi:hypothetical protein
VARQQLEGERTERITAVNAELGEQRAAAAAAARAAAADAVREGVAT